MGRWFALTLVLGLLGSAALACSSGGGDGGGVSPAELGARYCALFTPCCAQAGLGTEQQGCKLLFSLPPKDGAAAEACIAEYEARAQQADWCSTFANQPTPESCTIAYPEQQSNGTKQPGEPCQSEGDCAPARDGTVVCHHDFDTDQRYCQLRTTAAAGEACAGTQQGNITYLESTDSGDSQIAVCDHDQALVCRDGACAAVSPLGGSCAAPYDCDEGAYCGSGTCQERVADGQSCAEGPSACLESSYCSSSAQICTPRAADGAACDTNDQCESLYCDGSTCAKNPGPGVLALLALCS